MDVHHDYIPIPEIFWSFETGQPMEHCRLCEKALMIPGTNYLIEKAFRQGETIFEHALCLDCYTDCHESISPESRTKIQEYFTARTDLSHRREQLVEKHGINHEGWISNCMIKGFPVREVDEYQLYGFCVDSDLVFNGAPYVLCGEAIEEILDLLSAETLGVMAGLSDKLFGIDAPKDLLII